MSQASFAVAAPIKRVEVLCMGEGKSKKSYKKRWHNLWTTPNQNLKLGWVKALARLYSVLFQGFWWVSYTLGGFLYYVFLGLTKLFQKNCKQWRVSRSLLLPKKYYSKFTALLICTSSYYKKVKKNQWRKVIFEGKRQFNTYFLQL